MAGARLRTHVLHVSRGRGGNGAGPSGTKCQGCAPPSPVSLPLLRGELRAGQCRVRPATRTSASRPQSLGRAPASSSSASPAGTDARYGRHLCCRQHLLVAVDSDPDRNGGRGRGSPSSIRLTISGALPGCARRRDRRTVRPDRACRRESSPQFPAQASNYSSLGSGDAGGSSFALCFASGAWLALTFVRAARCFPLKLALSCREADLEGLRQ